MLIILKHLKYDKAARKGISQMNKLLRYLHCARMITLKRIWNVDSKVGQQILKKKKEMANYYVQIIHYFFVSEGFRHSKSIFLPVSTSEFWIGMNEHFVKYCYTFDHSLQGHFLTSVCMHTCTGLSRSHHARHFAGWAVFDR